MGIFRVLQLLLDFGSRRFHLYVDPSDAQTLGRDVPNLQHCKDDDIDAKQRQV